MPINTTRRKSKPATLVCIRDEPERLRRVRFDADLPTPRTGLTTVRLMAVALCQHVRLVKICGLIPGTKFVAEAFLRSDYYSDRFRGVLHKFYPGHQRPFFFRILHAVTI